MSTSDALRVAIVLKRTSGGRVQTRRGVKQVRIRASSDITMRLLLTAAVDYVATLRLA